MQPVRVRAKFFFEGDKKFFVKGVTYGPFAPDAEGEHFGNPEKAARDLDMMCEAGINLVRIYYVPPRWFLDLCAARGIRALISIPWAEHLEFLNNSKIRNEAKKAIRDGVAKNAGHPAVFGRAIDPHALFSYASYPPTEYLLPQNSDFVTFNVYLHRQEDFERYLARLQNLADDKPLILGEFGMDTIRHPEEEQAEMLRWHIESVVRGGLAGTIVYAWTDEWFRGGQEILDWAFGLVRRDRSKKPAFETVRELFHGDGPMSSRVKLRDYPKASVIVCSYNGAKTLDRCLSSLKEINYPEYEVILVDDGSTDETQEIAARHPWVKNIRQENKGLSFARNVGAHASSGDVIVYTDSDCMADPDWLYYLIGTLLSGDFAGVGGPNISPPAENWVQACVAAAPGGPSHVLLTDVVAEHIPGCNMAFHRWAFDQVGGFDPEYRKAGDDVDFCWRLQQSGGVIAFSPAAIVWHYRRFTLKAFRKQQEGYGEAESMLRFQHLVFFGPTGTAKWKGQIYGAPRFTWLVNKPVIYHGIFGEGLFQSIYPTPQSDVAAYLSSIEWVTLTAFIFAVSIPVPLLRIVPYLMFGGTLLVALSYMIHARLEAKHDTVPARLLVAFLALTQPLVRGWARYFTWLKFKRTPPAVIASKEKDFKRTSGSSTNLRFWSENGNGRELLLKETVEALENEGWNYSIDTGWKNWDIQVYGSFWWGIEMLSVTEYHGGPKCLTRVQLKLKMVATTVLVNAILLGVLAYQQLLIPDAHWWPWIPYGIFVLVLARRAHRLKRRVADLVEATATRCGFTRITKKA
jgi:glycosyltransferase involved in cell wall biosynthesis